MCRQLLIMSSGNIIDIGVRNFSSFLKVTQTPFFYFYSVIFLYFVKFFNLRTQHVHSIKTTIFWYFLTKVRGPETRTKTTHSVLEIHTNIRITSSYVIHNYW